MLMHIVEEFDKVKHIGFDKERCGIVLRRTHALPCACELARCALSIIPLNRVHVMWTRLSFSDISSSESSSKLSIEQKFDIILDRFKEFDIGGKVTIKSKLREIAFLGMTSICSPLDKVKIKGSQKSAKSV